MVSICSHLAERKVTRRPGISCMLHPAFRICLWLVLCLASFLSPAADTSNSDALLNRWFAAQANVRSWSADFTQTRSLKVMAQPLVATGHVWVTPNHFRWELGQPPQTIALRLPDQLFIIYPRLKRAEKYAFSAAPPGPV